MSDWLAGLIGAAALFVVGLLAFGLGVVAGHVGTKAKYRKWLKDNCCYLCQEKLADGDIEEEI